MKIKHENISITQFTELNDLRIYIIDNLGVEATINNIKKLKIEVFLESVVNSIMKIQWKLMKHKKHTL